MDLWSHICRWRCLRATPAWSRLSTFVRWFEGMFATWCPPVQMVRFRSGATTALVLGNIHSCECVTLLLPVSVLHSCCLYPRKRVPTICPPASKSAWLLFRDVVRSLCSTESWLTKRIVRLQRWWSVKLSCEQRSARPHPESRICRICRARSFCNRKADIVSSVWHSLFTLFCQVV
jgi:hypothetical protein